jgi:acyl-CoA synthetase (AMP-forming)/AMP-acid ligase II
VGRPADGVRVEIIRITEDPIASWSHDLVVPEGEVGEIVVRGPNVTRGYFGLPEADLLAKIPTSGGDCTGTVPGNSPEWSLGSGGLFHRMGDLGYRDERGRIWFCGRKSQRVVTSNGPLYTIPCEAVLNTHPDVARTALVGVGAAGRARPVLCVEPERWPGAADRARIRRELLEIGASHAHTREIRTILFHPSFPVDTRHNAKIFREKLAAWAARELE